MRTSAAAAWVFAVSLGVWTLILAGQILSPWTVDFPAIPRPSQPRTDVVVVEAAKESTDGGSAAEPQPTVVFGPASSDSATPILAAVPGPTTETRDQPTLLTGRSGYVKEGRVSLSLGWIEHQGLTPVVERRLAPLVSGTCGVFGPWVQTSTTATLPHGTCALYRVLVDGRVVVVLPEVVRYDGTRPESPELQVFEDGVREFFSGSTLYVAASGESLKPVAVSAKVDDPESGIAKLSFRNGDTEIGAPEAPWSAEFSPTPGQITVTAENGAGETQSSAVQVVVDDQAPAGGSLAYPSTAPAGAAVDVLADPGTDAESGIDSSTVAIERRLAVLAEAGCEEFGEWTDAASPSVAREGTCAQYRLKVRDNVGNAVVYGSDTVLQVPDTTAPTTEVTAPASGAVLSGVATVTADAADHGSGLRSLTIQVARCAGGKWSDLGTAPGAPSSVSWDTGSVDPGSYVIRSIAVDRAGNKTVSELVRVVVASDVTPPTTSIVTPQTGDRITGLTTVSAEADDPESGIRSLEIQFRADRGSWSDLATFAGPTGSAMWDTTSLDPGMYHLRSVAIDRRGNRAKSDFVTVEVVATISPDEASDQEDEKSDESVPPEESSGPESHDDNDSEGGEASDDGQASPDQEPPASQEAPNEQDEQEAPVEESPPTDSSSLDQDSADTEESTESAKALEDAQNEPKANE